MRIDTREPGQPITPYWRVIFDGIDVSRNCFLADDQTGEVGLYLMDDGGHFYTSGAFEAAQEFRSGRVVFLFDPQPAPKRRAAKELITS